MKVLVVNGPNLNMLGIREPEIYGSASYDDLVGLIEETAQRLGITVSCVQSNHEGVLIDEIQKAYRCYDGIVINPAGYTHTSVALLDALLAVEIPYVEVHLSCIEERESFRQFSYFTDHALQTIIGQGVHGYCEALSILNRSLAKE